MEKYLFLDIDGVINAFDRNGYDTIVCGGYTVTIIPAIRDTILRWIDKGFRLVWATTWCNHPEMLKEYTEAYGLPCEDTIDFSYVNAWDFSDDWKGCRKLRGVQTWLLTHEVADDAIIMWIDDDMGSVDIDWALANGVIAIVPDCRLGLNDAMAIRQIEEKLSVIDPRNFPPLTEAEANG